MKQIDPYQRVRELEEALGHERSKNYQLSREVKQLIRTESDLYAIHQHLDQQLSLYRKLVIIGQKLSLLDNFWEILQFVAESCVNDLEYERCIVFLEDEGVYRFIAQEGYYDFPEEMFHEMSFPLSYPLLQPLQEGTESILIHGSTDSLTEVEQDFQKTFLLNEMLILRLCNEKKEVQALLVVGNSAGQAEFMTRIGNTDSQMIGLRNMVALANAALTGAALYRSLEVERDSLEIRVEERTLELAAKESRIRAIMTNVADAIITIDIHGVIESGNHAVKTIFGYDIKDIVGSNITILMGEEDASLHNDAIKRYLESGSGNMIGRGIREVQGRRRNGEFFPIDISINQVELDDTILFVGVLRDITERKKEQDRLAESEEKTRLLLESIGEGVFGLGLDGKITFANPQMVALLGYQMEELIGKQAHSLIHHSYPNGYSYPHDFCWMRKTVVEGRIYHIDNEVLWKKDGTCMDVEYYSVPIRKEGKIMGAVVSFSDITERKKAQQERDHALTIISSSIQYASRIQRAILPRITEMTEWLDDYMIIWEPRDIVGGDLYWLEPWGNGLLIILGDCTGHGVPGAFVTLLVTGALNRAKTEVPLGCVDKLVERTHQLLQVVLGQHLETGDADDGMELGACYIPTDKSEITFVGARFELFVVNGQEVNVVHGTKKGIGYRRIPHDQCYQLHHLPADPTLSYYLVTDGFIDQIGGEKHLSFGKRRFRELLLEVNPLPMETQKERILSAFSDYQGSENRRDDVSCIGFRVFGSEACVLLET